MSTGTEHVSRVDLELWLRRGCALIVAAVAAYSSYEHQRDFALEGGADVVNAGLWPLSVDGLLLLATVGLFRSGRQSRRTRFVVWSAFLGCIAVSLAANIAAAPTLTWQPVLVAGWPPVALLLAVELLAHRSQLHGDPETAPAVGSGGETADETGPVATLAGDAPTVDESGVPTAQEVMWAHFLKEQSRGRTPTGADLDRAAGTNNYGRTVLRQWREQGRIPSVNGHRRSRGGAA